MRNWREFNDAWRDRDGEQTFDAVSGFLGSGVLATEKIIKRLEPIGILLAAVGLFIAITTFWYDYGDRQEERRDRQEERLVRAWQLLTTKAPGNSGKIEALEYLNGQGVSLSGIDLSVDEGQAGAYLRGVDLSGADLEKANFSGANLFEANFSGARLVKANFSGAQLAKANFRGAGLTEADLSDAYLDLANLNSAGLIEANLSDASLPGVSLVGADLREAVFLIQEQLEQACGDENTELPKGLTIRMCSETPWYKYFHGDPPQ